MQIRGFMMLELVVVLFISSLIMVLCLPRIIKVNYDDYLFGNEYLLKQTSSMTKKEMVQVDNKYNLKIKYPIYFNEDGNVNQAQTINGKKYNMVIHLGNGYLVYE